MMSAARSLLRSRFGAALIGALVLASVGGVAWATIPDSSGVIHGCYQKDNGQLRVIDPSSSKDKNASSCRKEETPLDWSQTGPQGPAGPQGPVGPSDGYVARPADATLTLTPATIGTLTLPAGSYVIGATARAVDTNLQGTVVCDLTSTDTSTETQSTMGTFGDINHRASLAMSDATTLATGGTVTLSCYTLDPSAEIAVRSVRLTAIAVGTLHVQ